MGLKTQFAAAAAVAMVAFLGYEGAMVWRAQTETPKILAAVKPGPLTLAALTPARRDMLLKVEDPSFYGNKGVDLDTPGQGMTTLAQGLVKRFYFHPFKPGLEKIEQTLIARYVFNPAVTKDRQLEMMLNDAYLGTIDGKQVIGFEQAAEVYYHTTFDKLTDDQFLSLVAMLIGPNVLDPIRHPQANAERVNRIKRLLAGQCKPTGWRDVTYKACAGTQMAAK